MLFLFLLTTKNFVLPVTKIVINLFCFAFAFILLFSLKEKLTNSESDVKIISVIFIFFHGGRSIFDNKKTMIQDKLIRNCIPGLRRMIGEYMF